MKIFEENGKLGQKGEFMQIDGERDPLKVAILKEIANLAKIRQRLTKIKIRWYNGPFGKC